MCVGFSFTHTSNWAHANELVFFSKVTKLNSRFVLFIFFFLKLFFLFNLIFEYYDEVPIQIHTQTHTATHSHTPRIHLVQIFQHISFNQKTQKYYFFNSDIEIHCTCFVVIFVGTFLSILSFEQGKN